MRSSKFNFISSKKNAPLQTVHYLLKFKFMECLPSEKLQIIAWFFTLLIGPAGI